MSKGSIMIVDDDTESLRLLADILTAEGFDVRAADSGELALAAAVATPPELALIDLRMPGMDGFELCRRLKAEKTTRQVPVIFVSGAQMLQERVEGLQMGAVDFVTKPFQRPELVARINTHLELSRLRLHLQDQVAERTAELQTANELLRQELSERKHAEQALRESEERFRTMADTAPSMIWVTGPDLVCTFLNLAFLEFTGAGVAHDMRGGWMSRIHPEDQARCRDIYEKAAANRENFQFECRMLRADGEYRWVVNTGAPRLGIGGGFAGYIGSCTDITEIKRVQEELLAARKLESLGVLAAGIAHDYNNITASILAEVDLALSSAPPADPTNENLNHIAAAATRGSEIATALMTYAGTGQAPEMRATDISDLVGQVLEYSRASLPERVSLETDLASGLFAKTHPAQIRLVVENLLMNAVEAIGDRKGRITICASPASSMNGGSNLIIYGLPPGEYLRISVADTGPGLPEDAQTKIFDPFYTTKFLGRGLGLAVVQGIVRSHGGTVRVASVSEMGSTFEVLLPSVKAEHASQPVPDARPVTAPPPEAARGPRVLLVEDEHSLRQAVKTALERRGYPVFVAWDGQTALEILLTQNDGIDAIVLDLTLPGLSGHELYSHIRRLRPGSRILLTSAYEFDGRAVVEGTREPPPPFIRKPYRINDLIGTLEALVKD
jgi:PAS domain S-box-containing protein